jgi:hypothetical protein
MFYEIVNLKTLSEHFSVFSPLGAGNHWTPKKSSNIYLPSMQLFERVFQDHAFSLSIFRIKINAYGEER